MSFSYANAGSGPSAGGIGWFNFGSLTLNPGQTIPGLTGTLNDGSTVTFDLSAPSSASMIFDAVGAPVAGNFGYTGYTGTIGNVLLQNRRIGSYDPSTFTISNIVVKDPYGNPITNYTTVVADAEDTNIGESWVYNTNGGAWQLLTTLGNNPPPLTGLGTQTVTITGTTQLFSGDYVFTTQSPKTLNFTAISNGGLEAVAIGFAVTKVTVSKDVGARINSADQFVLDIAGTPSDQVTTAGAATGIQPQVAVVYGVPLSTYTINEAMAPGSVSPLSAYTRIVSAINTSPGGTVPPTGSLPINFTAALGDVVNYTILNAVPEKFTKKVDKTFANLGDVLTYTVTIDNPNNFTLNNVSFTDPTPPNTSYIGNLSVSVPYTGVAPSSGLNLTIPPTTTATISWQVQIDTVSPILNPIVNLGTVNVPGGSSGSTNPVSTKVNYADLTSNGNFLKSVTPTNAQFGDILTYTLTIKNTGNVPANNVVITDQVPLGTTLVAGSTTASMPFTGDASTAITLTAPIPAGGTVTISFKVKVGNTTPPVNPIPNTASINYAYTADPTNPNGITKSGNSNTVTTPVSTAKLALTKTTDKTIAYVGDIITYNIAVKNTGNVPANSVVITDPIPLGTVLVPGSLTVSAPYSGDPNTAITLTNDIPAGGTVTITFKIKVTAVPLPNPIVNVATAEFSYDVGTAKVAGKNASNGVSTVVFANNYKQEINDIIKSVSQDEAALANIADSEGAKIQKAVSMANVTPELLLCFNKSVTDMTNSASLLESVLMQKLQGLDCQINGTQC